MGRPSKGDRKLFSSRLPRQVADRLEADAQARQCTYSDLIAAVLAERYELPNTAPMPDPAIDGRLPMTG